MNQNMINRDRTTSSPSTVISWPDRAIHRAILAVDIKGSTERTNSAKAKLRHAMYDLFETALNAAGITDDIYDPLVDRGDSMLALIRPVDEAPKALLLDTVVPTLAELLVDHNLRHPDQSFQLRVVVHAGEVHNDGRGWFGEALDLAFRLLDAAEVKKRLQADTPLVLVVSEHIYRSIVQQGYVGIDEDDFEPAVRVRVGDHRHQGWVRATRNRPALRSV